MWVTGTCWPRSIWTVSPSAASNRVTSSSGSRSTTGDGILTGISLADLMQRTGRSLADLADGLVERVPQVLVNVPIPQPGRLADCDPVWDAVAEAQAKLGHEGRVLLRASGTEPLVRVMVEAREETQANAMAAELARVVEVRARASRGLTRRATGSPGPRPPR